MIKKQKIKVVANKQSLRVRDAHNINSLIKGLGVAVISRKYLEWTHKLVRYDSGFDNLKLTH